MKTIYLKANTKAALIADIATVIDDYNGEIEFSNGTIHGHYIGQIMLVEPTFNEVGEEITPAQFTTEVHANLLVPEDFNESIFTTLVQKPNNPKHQFA